MSQINRIIAVYPGRFQPFHASHYAVYLYLVKRFGRNNVFITTSNKVEKGKSPFNFKQKQAIMTKLYGIPASNVIFSSTPYKVETFYKDLRVDVDKTTLVFPVPGKDKNFWSGKFYKGWIDDFNKQQLLPFSKVFYTLKTPEFDNRIDGVFVSGTSVRQMFAKITDDNQRRKLFKKIFNKFDEGVYRMMVEKLTESKIRNSKKVIKEGNSGKKVIKEGGSAGHMAHIFQDTDLTFKDLRQIINRLLTGNISVQTAATLKYDGQNIMVTWRGDRLVAARNKGHMKNWGENALDVSKMRALFSGRGEVQKAFVFAMIDLQRALSKLNKGLLDNLFEEGKKWLNLQIIYSPTANIIPYDRSMLVFHNISQFDINGNIVGADNSQAQVIYSALVQVNANVQKRFGMQPPTVVELPQTKQFNQRKSYYFGRLNALQNKYKLGTNSTLRDYNDAFWKDFIQKVAATADYKVPKNVMSGLIMRWSQLNKKYTVRDMKNDIDNDVFLQWVLKFDKEDHADVYKQNAFDWEVLFMQVTAQILKNLTDYMLASPQKAVQKIRTDLETSIAQIRSGADPTTIKKLEIQLAKLEAIGGVDAVVPTEGIVFTYKGNTYKCTGGFAPTNQIIGMLKYAR